MATLIRKTSDRRGRRAVLYLHGWNDYFFQTHLADYLSDIGYDFYALDLRRYGRSMRPGQLPGSSPISTTTHSSWMRQPT